MRSSSAHRHWMPYAAICVAICAYSMAPIFVREITASGQTIALYRLWIGLPIMWAITFVSRSRITLALLRRTLVAGALLSVEIQLGFTSFRDTTVANATLIGSLTPVLLFGVAGRMLGESITRRKVLWGALALAGILVFVLGGANSGRHSWFGDLMAVGEVFAWTGYFIATKKLRNEGVPAISMYTSVVTTALIFLTPVVLLTSKDIGAIGGDDWWWLVAMAFVLGVLGHTIFNWAHGHVEATVSSILSLASNVISVVLAWRIFGESLQPIQLVGGAVVLVAVGGLTVQSTGERADRPSKIEADVGLPYEPIDL